MKIPLLVAAAILAFVSTGARNQPASSPNMITQDAPASPESGSCHSIDGLPDATCTPGIVRTTSVDEICHGGSTRQFRPPSSYKTKLKREQIVAYGYEDTSLADYEEDHLISLEIGGDGSNPKNLWPESHTGKYNSFVKDKVENWLHKQICSETMTPEEAQHGIATDWRQYIPNVVPTSTKEVE